MLPRWRWSIAKAFGSVTATDLMLASPGRVLRSNWMLGSWLRGVCPRPPSWVIVILGLKGRVAQLTAWKGEEKSATVPWSPTPWEAIENAEQLVGLIVKLGRSIFT